MLHLSIYSFFPSFSFYVSLVPLCSFYGCALLATLCPISTFPPRTYRLSDATSSVKLYLSHAGVHFDDIWSHKFKRTRHQRLDCKRERTPPLPLFPTFQFLTSQPSARAGELFLRLYLKSIFRHWKGFYFLITLFPRTFNHTLPAEYCIVQSVCVWGGWTGWREKCDSDVGSEWKPRE